MANMTLVFEEQSPAAGPGRTEDAAACAADALTDFEQFIIHQRSKGYCGQPCLFKNNHREPGQSG